jgi:hypothetical protein
MRQPNQIAGKEAHLRAARKHHAKAAARRPDSAMHVSKRRFDPNFRPKSDGAPPSAPAQLLTSLLAQLYQTLGPGMTHKRNGNSHTESYLLACTLGGDSFTVELVHP